MVPLDVVHECQERNGQVWTGVCVRDLWFSVLLSGLSCVEVAFNCDGLLAVCSFLGCWLLSAFSVVNIQLREQLCELLGRIHC